MICDVRGIVPNQNGLSHLMTVQGDKRQDSYLGWLALILIYFSQNHCTTSFTYHVSAMTLTIKCNL